MVKAAQSGCKICKSLLIFREELGPDEAGERTKDPFSTYVFVISHIHEGMNEVSKKSAILQFSAAVSWLDSSPLSMPWKRIQLHIGPAQSVPGWWIENLEGIKIDLHTEPWHVRQDRFPARTIPENTGDTEVARLALDWLNNCRHNHKSCESKDRLRDSGYYPPRLIETSPDNFQICRVIIPKEHPLVKGSRYVAVSHCWGDRSPSVILTASNLDQMKEVMPWDELPKSFQEAIQTCSRLGYRYIWIDSLCIVQSGLGSEADWQRHISIMDKIYTNCEMNLAISHASNSDQGCFVNRDADFLQTAFTYAPVALHLESMAVMSNDTSNIEPANECTVQEDLKSNLVTLFFGHKDFGSCLYAQHPLRKRGWVFQERLLAPRSLHFGRDRIYWECNETEFNEYLPWGLSSRMESFSTHARQPFSLPEQVLQWEPRINLNHEDLLEVQEWWNNLVDWYSQTKLTYPSKDKLVAISAIARRFGRLLPSPYASGLFMSPSPFNLLWREVSHASYTRRCDDGCTESIRPDPQRDSKYRAPTW